MINVHITNNITVTQSSAEATAKQSQDELRKTLQTFSAAAAHDLAQTKQGIILKAQQLNRDGLMTDKKNIVYSKNEGKGTSNIQKLKSFGKKLNK